MCHCGFNLGGKVFQKWYGYKQYMSSITDRYGSVPSSWHSRCVNMVFQLKKYNVSYYSVRSRGLTGPLLGYSFCGILNIL